MKIGKIAYLVPVTGILIPLLLLFHSAGHINTQSFLALFAGVSSFCMMAVNIILSGRFSLIERHIGGLDKLYAVHKWSGIYITAAILPHKFVGMDLEGNIVSTSTAKLAVDVAEFFFPILLILLAISIVKRIPKLKAQIPYHFWRWTHRLMGIVFIAIWYHMNFVKAPFDSSELIFSYLNTLALATVATYLGTQFVAPLLGKKYLIENVVRHKSATEITARPLGKPIKCAPGNFAIISIDRRGLREPHPFTISAIQPDGTLQFSIRALGDYTSRLKESVQTGDTLRIKGGYGRFDFRAGSTKQIWVAGGIGITPFLAFADSLEPGDRHEIFLLYSVQNADEAIGVQRLQDAANRCENFKFKIFETSSEGRIDAGKLIASSELNIGQCDFWFCGPTPMRKSLEDGFKKNGTPPRSTHYEIFEFR